MGEKIKNLHSIKIGSSELMIELNEGSLYDERVIHVQNDKFRYVFKESDFWDIAGHVLRAKLRLDSIREKRAVTCKQQKKKDFTLPLSEGFTKSKEHAHELSILFESNDVDYRLIETGEKYASFIIFNEDYSKFKKTICKGSNLVTLEHPFGNTFGYKFLYKMRPFELIKYKDTYVEFFFQLPCMSLTPKTWMPLDRKIQHYLWSCNKTDGDVKYLDDIPLLIFKICWAVFKDGYFTEKNIHLINRLIREADRTTLNSLLKDVFFRFTDHLTELILHRQYDEIVPQYFVFRDY